MTDYHTYVGILSVNAFSEICSARHMTIHSDDGDGITTAEMNFTGDVSAYLTYTKETDFSYVSSILFNKKTGALQQVEHVPAYYNNVRRLMKWIGEFHARAERLQELKKGSKNE